MLELTPRAERYIATLRRERGVDHRAAARLVIRGGGVGFAFEMAPVAGHVVVDGGVIPVYGPSRIAEALGHTIIDVRDENGRASLVMRRQAARTGAVTRGGG